MQGPYSVTVSIDRGAPIALDEATFAAPEVVEVARRFRPSYRDAGSQTIAGVRSCASVAVALLLAPGETADVTVTGTVGTGREKRPAVAATEYVSRDRAGVASLSLGCRFGSRVWNGL